MKRTVAFLLTICLGAIVASSCSGSTSTTSKGPITVGSKMDTEGALLSQMIILVFRQGGFDVVDKSEFGSTPEVRKAIMSGELDIYPEYTGNGAFFFAEESSSVWKDAQKGYERVKMLDKQQNNIIWLTPAPADNTWAIAVTKALADQQNLVSLSDFADYVNGGGNVKLIGSQEFVTSAAALPAFQDAYGFTLKQVQLVVLQSGNTAQTERAAYDGTDGVNACMAYGTDGALSAFNLVVLTDPKGVQPVYEPTPIVRGVVHDKYPEIDGILAPIFKSLDLVTLQTLNGKIAVEGQNPVDVARAYLQQEGFLK